MYKGGDVNYTERSRRDGQHLARFLKKRNAPIGRE